MPGLREFFRSEAFVPTVAIFPPIDTQRLAGDLALAAEGRTRGGRGQPGPDETGLDEHREPDRRERGRPRGAGARHLRRERPRLRRPPRPGRRRPRGGGDGRLARRASDFQAAVAVWQARMATPAANIELAKGAFAAVP